MNNNSNNYKDNNIDLFLKIIRNIYLNKIIFNHLKLYKLFNKCNFKKYKEYIDFEYKDYITELVIDFWKIDSTYKLKSGDIKESVEILIFGFNSSHSISVGVIPNSVKYLEFRGFNKELTNILPNGLEVLFIENTFNSIIRINDLPVSLKVLNLGSEFNQDIPVGLLPDSITSLDLGYNFSKVLEVGSIPSNVERLKLPHYYRLPLSVGVFPAKLKYLVLKFDGLYDESFKQGILPDSLKTLILGSRYNHTFKKNSLPPNIEELQLGYCYKKKFEYPFPSSLKHLDLGHALFDHPIKQGILPNSLTTLIFSSHFNQVIEPFSLPSGIQTIKFGTNFNQPLNMNVLPSTLTSLYLGDSFQNTLKIGDLPYGLKELSFGFAYKEPIYINVIPYSVTTIKINYSYNNPIIFLDSNQFNNNNYNYNNNIYNINKYQTINLNSCCVLPFSIINLKIRDP